MMRRFLGFLVAAGLVCAACAPLSAADKVRIAVANFNVSFMSAGMADGGMDEKGIRDALKRETDRMGLKEETPLSRVLDLSLLKEVQKRF